MANQERPEAGGHENETPRDRYDDAEAQLGGADSVEKTTYVTGSGTSPEARATPGVPAARVASRGVWGIATWVLIAIIVLVVVGYLAGIGRG